jgi:hypothetical protein
MAVQQLRGSVPYVAQRCSKSVKHNADRNISHKYGLDISNGSPALFDDPETNTQVPTPSTS